MKKLSTLAAALLLSCGIASANTLRWAAQNDIQTLDPHSQNHSATTTISGYAYEGLTRYTEKFDVEPALATKWTFVSPTQVRFDLRRGVKFHDGTPFTADDVVFSLQRIKHPASNMVIYSSGIKEVKKIDDFTVDLILDGPNPVLTRNLTFVRIVSKAWAIKNRSENPQDYKAKEDTFASRNANGTGPFKITSWTPDQKLTMTANKDWWDKPKGNISEVTYLPIKQDATRVAALLSGALDLLTDLPPQDVAKLKADPRLKVIEGPENRTIFFALDLGSDEIKGSNVKGKNPFKDRRVREAMSLAIDREAIKRSLMRNLSIPAAIMVAPVAYGWSQELDTVAKPDLARAKQLMTDAGYAEGFETPLACPNDRYVNDGRICQTVAANLSRINVKINLAAETKGTYFPKVLRRDTSFYMLGWTPTTYDSHNALNALMICPDDKTGAGQFNLGAYCNPKLDELTKKILVETDKPKRDAMIKEAFEVHTADVGHLPLHQQALAWGVSKKVKLVQMADNYMPFKWITVSK